MLSLPSDANGAEIAAFLIALITPLIALFAAMIAAYAIHNQKWLTIHRERAWVLVDGGRSFARMEGAEVLATLYLGNVGPTLASEIFMDASAEIVSGTGPVSGIASKGWTPWVLGGSSIEMNLAFPCGNVAGALEAVTIVVGYSYRDFVGKRRQEKARVKLPISSTRLPGENLPLSLP